MNRPICIITASGMVCASSKPMKRHFPHDGPERPVRGLDAVVDDVAAALRRHRVSGRETIATVVQLMVQVGVNDATPFTVNATLDKRKFGHPRGRRKVTAK